MIEAFAVSLLAILGFALALIYLDIVAVSRNALDRVRSGGLAMLDNELSDEEKEAAVQAAGLALLKSTFDIAWRFSASLLAAAAPVYLLDYLGLVPAGTVIDLMLRWDYIVGTTLVLCAAAWLANRRRRRDAPQSAYSPADQLVHRLAFAGPGIQLTAADMEDRLFAARLRKIEDRPPIFITSLPRAGTTILLTALNDIPGLATHLYRDMPFVMAPLLWSRISGLFRRQGEMVERAHKDGIKIGYDSPEAFEEVIWRAFWPEKYRADHIQLWCAEDAKTEASEFFLRHFRKIVALRSHEHGRYVSKNNNNIARLDILEPMFPGSQVIVPLREPAEHCASLLRQHVNFLEQHAADPFTERYMRDIGHLEFGTLHTPFAFPSFEPGSGTPEQADYWLDYWIAAYEMVLERAARLHFVSQDRLGTDTVAVLRGLCERLGLEAGDTDFTRHIRPVTGRVDRGVFDAGKLARATELYQALLEFQI